MGPAQKIRFVNPFGQTSGVVNYRLGPINVKSHKTLLKLKP